MEIVRGSTPTHTFSVDVDLRDADAVYLTYSQGLTKVERTKEDLIIEADSITTTLSQRDTLSLREGEVEIQIRYKMPDGAADGSKIVKAAVLRILKDGEI